MPSSLFAADFQVVLDGAEGRAGRPGDPSRHLRSGAKRRSIF